MPFLVLPTAWAQGNFRKMAKRKRPIDISGINRLPERFFPKVDVEWYRRRLYKVMFCILPVFCLLGARMFYLQILNGEHFNVISKDNCLRKLRNEPLRGQILDRNGTLLVDNRPAFELHIVPEDAKPLDKTAEKLAHYISMTPQEIKTVIAKGRGSYGYRTIMLKRDIGRDTMARLLSHQYDLPGILIQISPLRNYINDETAAHLIGYLGEISFSEIDSNRYPKKRSGDLVGRYGIEKTFENELSGDTGFQIVQVSATGQIMRVLGSESPKPGNNVYLTIDLDVQRTAESLLKDNTGAVVAVDATNGDVLALASSPTYDQNAFIGGITNAKWNELINDPERPMHNKAIQGEYPPGSTFKIITAMAGLEEGVVTEHTTSFCPGQYQFGNRSFRCWKKGGHGTKKVIEALAESCDVYFYHLGKQLGVDRIAWYARACGLGVKTGIDLSHEAGGLIPTAAWKKRRFGVSWQAGETLPIAIGQGYNLTTPLQMAMLYAGIANGGKIFKPQILKTVQGVEGAPVYTPEPEIRFRMPASERTLAIIREGLRQVVNDRRGTAYAFVHSPYVEICGKTGTAEVISRKDKKDIDTSERASRKYKPHAWFVGYAPADSPKIAVSVIVEHGWHGSSTAGPIAKEIIVTYLKKSGIVPEHVAVKQISDPTQPEETISEDR